MRFYKQEIKDLAIAWLMISVAFTILFSPEIAKIPFTFLFSGLTVGIAFIMHELCHKYYAEKYHLRAEFVANYQMLFMAMIFALFGFIIAAPGAVMISGIVTRERNGKISLAGPLSNIILAIISLILIILLSPMGILGTFLSYSLTINSLLGAFNMIPIIPFDGSKILRWNKPIYFITLGLGVILFFSRGFI